MKNNEKLKKKQEEELIKQSVKYMNFTLDNTNKVIDVQMDLTNLTNAKCREIYKYIFTNHYTNCMTREEQYKLLHVWAY